MGLGNLFRSKAALYLIATACTGGGAYLAYTYVSQAGKTALVAVAARDIPPYTTLRAEDMAAAPKPVALLPKGVVRTPRLIAGRTTRTLIPAGTSIVPQFLAGEGQSGGGLARTLRDAGRQGAVSLRFASDDAVAGRLDIGDRVDIQYGYKNDDNTPVADVLSGILILDVVRPDAQQANVSGGGVTIVVEADEALAQQIFTTQNRGGKMTLRLRPTEVGR